MAARINYSAELDASIMWLMRNAIRITLKKPSRLLFFVRMFLKQKTMVKRRKLWENKGVHVPPFMIASVTNKCNLRCKGCYNRAQHRNADGELPSEKLQAIISEASQLGISFILLAGGEPLMRPEIAFFGRSCPDVIFPLFTNGILIGDKEIAIFKENKNLIPIISIEGNLIQTDERRGQGVYNLLMDVFSRLMQNGIFFGVSITVTRENYNIVTGSYFVTRLVQKGCGVFFYVEYVPVTEDTDSLILEDQQRNNLPGVMEMFRKRFPALFTAFPGDEGRFGGCLSAGRGFVHVSSDGSLEPCPFAPYSDISLKDVPLKEALNSNLLKKIRENHSMLTETKGGCALWENRDWVKSLL